MELTVVLLMVVFGALWRRWHGMGGAPRLVRLLVAFLLAATPWLYQHGLDFWHGYLVALAVTAYWIPGHDWTSLKKLLLRYGPAGLFWHWAHKVHRNDPHAFRWGWPIDGPFAIAEIMAGAFVFGANGLVAVLI